MATGTKKASSPLVSKTAAKKNTDASAGLSKTLGSTLGSLPASDRKQMMTAASTLKSLNDTSASTRAALQDMTGNPYFLAAETPGTSAAKKKSGGSGSGAAETAAANPYASQLAEWTEKKNALREPAYTDRYAEKIAALEAEGSPEYTSAYQEQIDALLDALSNRESFAYSLSEDPLYRQYRDQYLRAGQSAMRDTMGQAAALTGGYGSSYASTAGNQAYQSYLNALNSKALDLQQNALDVYTAEGSRLQDLLENYQMAENAAYGRYQDDRTDYYNRLGALRQGQSADYSRYQGELEQYNNAYNTALEQYLYWLEKYNGAG